MLRLDQVNGVAFVATKLRADRMSINRYPQDRIYRICRIFQMESVINQVEDILVILSILLILLTFCRRLKPATRHSWGRVYRARECVRPYRGVRAGSRAWLFVRDLFSRGRCGR